MGVVTLAQGCGMLNLQLQQDWRQICEHWKHSLDISENTYSRKKANLVLQKRHNKQVLPNRKGITKQVVKA